MLILDKPWRTHRKSFSQRIIVAGRVINAASGRESSTAED